MNKSAAAAEIAEAAVGAIMAAPTAGPVAPKVSTGHDTSTGKFIRDVFFSNLPTPFLKFRAYLWLAVLARKLGPAGYGAWSLFSVTLGIAVAVASMNMGSAMMRFLSGQRTSDELNRALSTTLVAMTVTSLSVALISASLAHWSAAALFHSPDGQTLILLMALALPFDIQFENIKGLLRARRMNSRWAALVLGRLFPETIVTILAGAVLVSATAVAGAYVVCSALAAASAIYFVVRILGVRPARPDWKVLRRYLSFGLPLLPGAITYFLSTNADRYLVGYYLDVKQVGIYSVCFTISALAFFLVGPINDVLFPELSALYDSGDKQAFLDRFGGIQKFVFCTAAGAAALQIAFPADMLHLLASRDYTSGAPALALLGLNGIFMACQMLYSAILNVHLKVWSYSWLWMGTGAGVVVLDIFLLPKVGIAGAALSQLVTSVIGSAILIALNWHLFRGSFRLRWVAQNSVGMGATLLLAYWLPRQPAFSAAWAIIRISAGAAVFVIGLAITGYFRASDLKMFRDALSSRRKSVAAA